MVTMVRFMLYIFYQSINRKKKMFKSKELMSDFSARRDAHRRHGLLWLEHSETFPNAFTFCIDLTRNQKASAGCEDLQKEAKNSVEVPPFRARSS